MKDYKDDSLPLSVAESLSKDVDDLHLIRKILATIPNLPQGGWRDQIESKARSMVETGKLPADVTSSSIAKYTEQVNLLNDTIAEQSRRLVEKTREIKDLKEFIELLEAEDNRMAIKSHPHSRANARWLVRIGILIIIVILYYYFNMMPPKT